MNTRSKIQLFAGLVVLTMGIMYGLGCRTCAPTPRPLGATVGIPTAPTSTVTGPIGCTAIDPSTSQCVQGAGWTPVPAFTATIVWSQALSPQDVGNFVANCQFETPGALDNTGLANFNSSWGLALNADASTMAGPEAGAGTTSLSQIGSQYQNADAAAAPTCVFLQVAQTLELVATSPVATTASAYVRYERRALAPWVLNVDAATLGSPVTTPTTVLVTTTPGATGGIAGATTYLMLEGQGPFLCTYATNTTATCVIPPGVYQLDSGAACLSTPGTSTFGATPFCEQNAFTFTDSGPG